MSVTEEMELNELHDAVLRGDKKAVTSWSKSRKHRDQRNVHGATPLMLAALAGNPIIVCILLINQADFRGHDKFRRHIRDYARHNRFTADLIRLYRAHGYPMRRADSIIAKREILTLFRDPEALRSIYRRRNHALSGSYIYLDTTHSFVLWPQGTRVNVGDPIGQSTIGFISGDGEANIDMAAVSGWQTNQMRNFVSRVILDKEEYTSLVRNVCQVLHFNLPGSFNDNGYSPAQPEHKGQYHACQ